jgi:hypothetical protein
MARTQLATGDRYPEGSEACVYCGEISADYVYDHDELIMCRDAQACEARLARQAESRHYHLDDYPLALDVLAAVANARDLSAIGYEPTESGAFVNWDRLGDSWLSTTEQATVAIARGIALAERQGLPARVSPAIQRALAELTEMCGHCIYDHPAGSRCPADDFEVGP